MCVLSNDKNLLNIIKKNQKRADDALATISQLQNDSYDKNRQGEYDRAVNIFNATNYVKEGIFSGILKDPDGALSAYEDALKLYPGFSEAYYQRADIYRGMSKNQEAISEYSQAIKYDSDNANYYIARGICYFDMKKQDLAIKDYKEAAGLGCKEAREFLDSHNIEWR